MARPNSNGIVALHDDKESDSGFFCMKLVGYLNEESEMARSSMRFYGMSVSPRQRQENVPIVINAPFTPKQN